MSPRTNPVAICCGSDVLLRGMLMIVAVFVFQQAAQLAMTPLNEGMDFLGHLAYISFVTHHARPPSPDEPSLPAWIDSEFVGLPGPDFTDGSKYQAWAQLSAEQRHLTLITAVQPQSTDVNYV